jgi:hypothetical protein
MKSFAAALILGMLSANTANACLPVRATVHNVARSIERSTEVFLGTVAAVDLKPGEDIGRVRFTIREVFKGQPTDQTWYFYTRPNQISCSSLPAKIGYEAIIFIWRDPKGWLWAGPRFGLGSNREMVREALGAIDNKTP